jgi:hypothetical protein
VTVVDSLSQAWTQLLEIIGRFVSPDWGAAIAALPLLIVVGVLGPILTLLALIWMSYFVRKPRTAVTIEEGPRAAPLDDAGLPVYPPGEPYCARDALIYPPGTTRCDRDDEPLSVICPMCGIGRDAAITTCGNCGLVLKVENRVRVLRPSTPPPGGAALA